MKLAEETGTSTKEDTIDQTIERGAYFFPFNSIGIYKRFLAYEVMFGQIEDSLLRQLIKYGRQHDDR